MEAIFQVLVFYGFVAMTLFGAVAAAFSRRLIRSVFALLLTLLGVAGLYVFLSADFLAAVQVLLYAGGILVLMVFGVMLTHRIADVTMETQHAHFKTGLILCSAMFLCLVMFIFQVPWPTIAELPPHAPTTRAIGMAFLGDYLVPFEYASIVLLVVVLGAATLARKEVE
ncbi:MAG: NADH-quinone oxidoreductase subunit J [Candidatus Riflebacteria bacterium]|nr:NADH-quinone oxidoreductase subunit J [Candidatus Riflebacteria bacterium]